MTSWTRHVKLTGDWNKVQADLRRDVLERRFETFVGAELNNAGLEAVRVIKAFIKTPGKYRKNSPMTVMIKQATAHLVDTTQLLQSVQMTAVSKYDRWVGASSKRVSMRELKIALRLHEGMKIKISPRMRRMFEIIHAVWMGKLKRSYLRGRAAVLFARNPRGPWMPFKKGKRAIRVPARPFIERVRSNKAYQAFFKRAMMAGVRRAVKR
jgi:hypothetical protein